MATPRTAYERTSRRTADRTMSLMTQLTPTSIAAIQEEFAKRDDRLSRVEFVELLRAHLHAAATAPPTAANTPAVPPSAVEPHARSAASSPTTLPSTVFPMPPSTTTAAAAAAASVGVSISGGGAGLFSSATPATSTASPRSDEDDDLALVGSLNDLFHAVDVMGDGAASWDSFSRYVVEQAVVGKTNFSVDAVAEYTRQLLQPVPKSHKDPNAIPNTDTAIPEKVKYLPSIDCIAVVEARNPVVKIVDAQNLWSVGELNAGAKGHRGSIEALAYIEPNTGARRRDSSKGPSYLITSGSDSTIALWALAPGLRQFAMVHRFSTPYSQPSLCYAPTYNMLYSGSSVGMVHTWDLKHGFETSCMTGHTDVVLDMLHIPYIEQLASCSLDRTVRVWDMCTGAPRLVLRGHTKGVSALTYCEDYRFLISAGYDHEANIWSPLVPAMLYQLKGHNTPLVSVRHIPSTPEVVTASIDGQVKVWDMRTLKCVQTINDSIDALGARATGSNLLSSFDVCPPRRQIVTAAHHLHIYRQVTDASLKSQTESAPIAVAVFNPRALTIVVASGRAVSVWSVLTGTLLRTHRDLAAADITAMTLDHRCRVFYLGCADGSVRSYSCSNGALMKELVPHSSEGRIMSASHDRKVVIHDDSIESEEDVHQPKGIIHKHMDCFRPITGDVMCGAYSPAMALVAAGVADHEARLWEADTAKLVAMLPHAGTEVLAVVFLDPHPVLFTADSQGNNHLWGLDTTTGSKYGLLTAWRHDPSAFRVEPTAAGAAAGAGAGAGAAGAVDTGAASTATATAATTSDSKLQDADGGHADGEGHAGDTGGDAAAAPSHVAAHTHVGVASHATTATFDAATNTLYTGDFAGQLTAWDLSSVLDAVATAGGTPSSPPLRPTSPVSLPHASPLSPPDFSKRRARLAPQVTSVLLSGPDLVAVRWCICGHDDSINRVQLCSDGGSRNRFILTAGYDCVVQAWALSARHLGTLCRSVHRGRNPDWDVPWDVSTRRRADEASARETLATVLLSSRALTSFAAEPGTDDDLTLMHPMMARSAMAAKWGEPGGRARHRRRASSSDGAAKTHVLPPAAARPLSKPPPTRSTAAATDTDRRVATALAAVGELNIRKAAPSTAAAATASSSSSSLASASASAVARSGASATLTAAGGMGAAGRDRVSSKHSTAGSDGSRRRGGNSRVAFKSVGKAAVSSTPALLKGSARPVSAGKQKYTARTVELASRLQQLLELDADADDM